MLQSEQSEEVLAGGKAGCVNPCTGVLEEGPFPFGG